VHLFFGWQVQAQKKKMKIKNRKKNKHKLGTKGRPTAAIIKNQIAARAETQDEMSTIISVVELGSE